MKWVILSLDVSAASTGWCVMSDKNRSYGLITTKPKFNRSQRLNIFRKALTKILKDYNPTHIVIEDTYSGLNKKTLKILSEFAGVAKEACQAVCNIDPYVISTNTVKAYFKVKGKEDLFYFMLDVLDFEDKGLTFEKDNDIIDSIAQAMCYLDKVLGKRRFRTEKNYGFLYSIKGE